MVRPVVWWPPAEQAVIKAVRRAKLFVFLRLHRHELFDERFQAELAEAYVDSPKGQPPVPPIVACMASGFVVDATMKNLGLGPISNGIVALIGVCAGIYLRYRLFGISFTYDVFVTIGFALGFAVFLFLAMAFAKSRGFL